MSNTSDDYLKRIVEILREHPEGLTIQDLSKITGAHRQTVTKYVLWLDGAGIVYRRRIGAITLQYLKKDFEALKNINRNSKVNK
jgi:DNA-binding IclR family transcriptional regulator